MNYNEELTQLYFRWIREVDGKFDTIAYSNPYLTSAPIDWDSKTNRLMFIGQEGNGCWGAGKCDWNPTTLDGITRIMQYNEDYVYTQIVARKKFKDLSYNKSPYWNVFRRVYDMSSDISIVWNNIDKFHYTKQSQCQLSHEDRCLLHETSIKVLQEEIKILKPTHLIFLGWYWESLRCELPSVFEALQVVYKKNEIAILTIDGMNIIFSNHPTWINYNPQYKAKLFELIQSTLAIRE